MIYKCSSMPRYSLRINWIFPIKLAKWYYWQVLADKNKLVWSNLFSHQIHYMSTHVYSTLRPYIICTIYIQSISFFCCIVVNIPSIHSKCYIDGRMCTKDRMCQLKLRTFNTFSPPHNTFRKKMVYTYIDDFIFFYFSFALKRVYVTNKQPKSYNPLYYQHSTTHESIQQEPDVVTCILLLFYIQKPNWKCTFLLPVKI